VQVRGTIAFEETGEGPLAVFVHGFPLDHRLWLDQLASLPDVCRCVAPDLPGFGESRPLDEFTMERVADELARFIGGAQADIVALSMGGYVALALWERHPDVVRSLALLDTKASADTPDARRGRGDMAAQVIERGTGSLVEGMTGALLAPEATAGARRRLREMIESTSTKAVVAALDGMAQRKDRTALLGSISVPTMVLVGEMDTLTPPQVAVEMAARIPNATASVVSGAGHLTPIEAPEQVSAALRRFLTRR
jgi:3-oxoadipate enol-lactonase